MSKIDSDMPHEMRAAMRDAVKEAERRVQNQWWQRPRPAGPRLQPQSEAAMRAYDEAMAAARAAVREDFRARWKQEKAAQETPLPAHITRLLPEELRIEPRTLRTKREAYLAEAKTLDLAARKEELTLVVEALGLSKQVITNVGELMNWRRRRGSGASKNWKTG